ncbi:winged helix-turn-helix domain-containing protein [Enterovibrio baiacu]|uniref:winged helix-turn-helix domain-containing protein n=1 Tax=Enterovibrio baiacu TaxID=2491023 RepID=UPI0010113915|nr:winged helix-turn-helix domain-containing protein [Enterovibrio baiacu]MBE1274499.1 winged helix-turn-helix domain-containing protein [Enterovibrio baiacu]
MSFAGVITGDIVDSTKMDEATRRQCLTAIEGCFTAFGNHANGDIYRGDAFQIYTLAPEQLLYMAIKLRLSLLRLEPSADVRLSLSIAKATPRELPVRMSNNSEAFLMSGRHLDAMKSARLTFSADDDAFADDGKIVCSLLDDVMSGLTTKMALALDVWIENTTLSHAELAEKLGLSRSAFTRVINRASYTKVEDVLDWYQRRYNRYLAG